MERSAEVAAEQAVVDSAYARLAARRRRLDDLDLNAVENTPGGLLERDRLAAARDRRQAELAIGDAPLCFGRIDGDDGSTWHIGRLGVDDDAGDPVVVDWRAPVAEPFYRATFATRLGVVRRRHLFCRAATVLDVSDELLTDHDRGDLAVVGEAALFRALTDRRTGRMRDIVATIQARQDEIVRAPLDQALVVQGGPGTGKTVVALHRIAYLLFTHREALEAKGVLLLGPSATFLRYIEQVLPSLGEQRARLTTIGALRTGQTPTALDPQAAAAVKGDLRMAEVVQRAVASRQRPLRKPVLVPFGAFQLRFSTKASERIVAAARAGAGSHNARRALVERRILLHLHGVYLAAVDRAATTGRRASPMSRDEFLDTARRSKAVRILVDRMWPLLTPEQLLADLLGHPALLREAADDLLTADEQAAIVRPPRDEGVDGWTEADEALLDEAAVVLGPLPRRRRARAAGEDREWLADRVLDGVAADPNVSLSPTMAREIRDRIRRDEVTRPAATRPRTVSSSFGHVVVDEAQDLSPMQWRMIARRCPSGSLTIVGDLGQASSHWHRDWHDVLDQVAPDRRRRVTELDVNYRTPSEVMEVAARVLAAGAPGVAPSRAVRAGGTPIEVHRTPRDGLVNAAAEAARELAGGDRGTVAVIAPAALQGEIGSALDDAPATRRVGTDPLLDPVALLTTTTAKGLEFDRVIVVEPQDLVDEQPRGLLSLYIALTRTTGRLVIVHARPLPAPLAGGGASTAATMSTPRWRE
ncbi:MAG TPA: UvrD-helicase domain-containing protein [Acidimicrobiales bacterium]|nr:UvrD-helicase domain-containing protein [Acidimicrobiales bacterium]